MLSRTELEKLISRLAKAKPGTLKAIAEGASDTTEAMIASIMLKTIELGDVTRFTILMDRAVGRVKEVVETRTVSEELDTVPTDALVKLVANAK